MKRLGYHICFSVGKEIILHNFIFNFYHSIYSSITFSYYYPINYETINSKNLRTAKYIIQRISYRTNHLIVLKPKT